MQAAGKLTVTGKTGRPAFYAVARGIASHRLLRNEKHPFSRREALEWLFEKAAYRPMGQRLSYGVADVQRGQLATTIRGLASAWRWPRWRVEYFLRLFKEDGTIITEAIPTKIQTNSTVRNSYRATLITLCNYNIYQGVLKASESGAPRQSLRTRFRQDLPQLPGLACESGAENKTNQMESLDKSKELADRPLQSVNYGDKSKSAFRNKHLPKPRHGAENRDYQWFDFGTREWKAAAEWDSEIRGIERFPEHRQGGAGNWFKKWSQGEAIEWQKRMANGR